MGKMLRQPLRLIPPDICLPILQGRLRGKRWITGSSIHGCWLGSYESDKQRLFETAIREGDTVFDIGANVGFYTLLASVMVGASGQVYAFEPLPRNTIFLNRHLVLNRAANVKVFEVAIADANGEAYFDDSPNNSMGHLSSTGTRKVRTMTIDDLVFDSKIAPPNCIKIDVEGAETCVLAGARLVLERYQPTIFLATHGPDVHSRSCQFLDSLGYTLESIGDKVISETDEILAYHT